MIRQERGEVTRREQADGVPAWRFWQFLQRHTSNHHSTWVWAHNLLNDFRWLGGFRMIDEGKLWWGGGSLEAPPTVFRCGLPGRTVLWVDTLNWFRTTLAQLGKDVGVPKLEMPPSDARNDEWLEYCKRDVLILERTITLLLEFVRKHDLGMMRATAPGQAWHSWRHIHKGVMPLIHGKPWLSQFERSAYYAGRTELFFRGIVREDTPERGEQKSFVVRHGPTIFGEKVYVLDATAFYPSLMRGTTFPYQFEQFRESLSVDGLANILTAKAAIAEVCIKTDADVYPVRHNGRVIYPRGRYWTTLAGPELCWALARGQIEQVGHVAVYAKADLFTEWVDKVWRLRTHYKVEKFTGWEMMCKVLHNSLYGKFGSRGGEWKDIKDHPCRVRWGHWLECPWEDGESCLWRGIGGNAQLHERGGEWKDAFVAIPAYVTSRGRVAMREYMELLPEGSLLYSDTDSLHVTHAGYEALSEAKLLEREGMGGFKIEGIYSSAEYVNRKIYRVGDKTKAAGIPRRAEQLDNWKWAFDEWQCLSEMLSNPRSDAVTIRRTVASIKSGYEGGKVGADGWVSPLRMEYRDQDWPKSIDSVKDD